MLMQIRAEQVNPPEQVKNVLLADEFSARLGFGENAVQFVEPALRNHVDVRHYLVALWVSHQVDIQSFGAEQNPGSNFSAIVVRPLSKNLHWQFASLEGGWSIIPSVQR